MHMLDFNRSVLVKTFSDNFENWQTFPASKNISYFLKSHHH